MPTTFRSACRADEVAPGSTRLVTVDGREIALFNVGGTFHATEASCLHAGGPLHEGTLRGRIVVCPWHQWEFDVATGACNLNPCVSLTRYEVRVAGGIVEIAV